MADSGTTRRSRLEAARLYLVTGARRDRGDLDDFLDAVLGAGVDIVQLREKDAEAGDLLRWSAAFRAAADRRSALFVINDRPDVALAAGADGVHLGQNDLPPAIARAIVGPSLLIGLSTHTPREFDAAAAEADYLCAGPVYATPTKPGRAAVGTELIAAAARRESQGQERRPWFAIGGIDAENLAGVHHAGARRFAVVRAVGDAPDPAAAASRLSRLAREQFGAC